MKATLPLRCALASNAAFSLTCGLLMLFRPAQVGDWLGQDARFMLQAIGLGLVVFAGELLYQATRQRVATWRALLASAADASWVIASVVLLLTLPQLFSPLDQALVLTVAAVVLAFGAWQLWAAGRAHRIGEGSEYRHCIVVETNVPAEKLWRVVGNMGDIQHYMPSLKRSVVLDGNAPGVGAVRTCEDHSGKKWSEECTAFNPGHSFAVRFVSEAPNFPFPAKTMRGGWQVAASDSGSQVMVWWELTPTSKLLAPVILPLLAFQADRDFPQIVRRMATAAIGKNGEAQMHSNGRLFARLLPGLC